MSSPGLDVATVLNLYIYLKQFDPAEEVKSSAVSRELSLKHIMR
jgi:hypothetical protein